MFAKPVDVEMVSCDWGIYGDDGFGSNSFLKVQTAHLVENCNDSAITFVCILQCFWK